MSAGKELTTVTTTAMSNLMIHITKTTLMVDECWCEGAKMVYKGSELQLKKV